jgi:4-hydroxybenzoate polyprenyltransferase
MSHIPAPTPLTAETKFPAMSPFALFKEHVYLSRFAFTLFIPLVSAAVVTHAKLPELSTILTIIVVAWCFHMTYYGFNDFTDYELDKVLSRKDDHPLVRGDISRRTALVITVLHTIAIFIIEVISGTTFQLILLLAIACGGVIIYDLFGKKNPFPPLTDAIESIGFVALSLYGATKAGNPSILSYILAINIGIFLNFVTGCFLGIVDLTGDLKGGARTTAIWLGVHPVKGSPLAHIPRSLTIFGCLQIFLLMLMNFLPLVRNDFAYSPMTRTIIMAIVMIISIVFCIHTIRFIISGPSWQKVPEDFDQDLLALYSILILMVTYLPYVSFQWLLTLAICIIIPIAISKILGKIRLPAN